MISGELKSKVDKVWDAFWTGGISNPLSAIEQHAWLIPKSVLLEHVIGKMGQHTGAAGADTAWLSFNVGEEYEWMKPHGGSLAEVKAILNKLSKGPHVAPPSKTRVKVK